jgi:hypothetical protein
MGWSSMPNFDLALVLRSSQFLLQIPSQTTFVKTSTYPTLPYTSRHLIYLCSSGNLSRSNGEHFGQLAGTSNLNGKIGLQRKLTICAETNIDFKLGLTATAVNVHLITAPSDAAANDSSHTWGSVSISCWFISSTRAWFAFNIMARIYQVKIVTR